ncbi:hypothetical protein pdam_00017733 [Pocillopora damicornis]|uniref:Uncharacterized protein n=1 Tax=Pocillopora damicornis TaxID=46731 RepID=A0A3M6UDD2_POCDA|nr:hypothetical protein pdam_00017733 [Pocillopora damicornis]
MEGCCLCKSLIGGVCGYNTRDRKRETEVVPLLSCSKNIASHRSAFKFTGPKDEIDPILCVASMFTKNTRSSTMTICPNHRAKLGLGWTRGSSTRCRVPERISNHNKGKGVWPKGERGLGKRGSEAILRKTGACITKLQTIVGPSPLAIRETRIMLAPVVMITTLHVIDATY